jgi:ribonuclease P protein component
MHTRREETKHISRLLKRADFLRVQNAGQKWVTPTCIVQMADTDPPNILSIRYGLTITKKIWPRAVDRNRVRRRVRAVALAVLVAAGERVHNRDIVILPRAAALTAPVTTLDKDLTWAIKRLTTPDNKTP